jgi:hypothetical protein
LKQLQLIQILSINAQTLPEPPFPSANGPRVNPRWRRHDARKRRRPHCGGRLQGWKYGVLPRWRFTAR